MKKIVFLLACALLIVVIASNTTYSQQSIIPELRQLLKNEPFKDALSHLEFNYWNQTISIETRGYVHFIEFLIRKTTHFIGYGLIGMLFYLFYRKLRLRLAGLYGVASVFFIACLDEYRQTTIIGRTGTFKDVLLDTAGAIFFISLTYLILILYARWKRRKTKHRI